jgi:hypothetical protein
MPPLVVTVIILLVSLATFGGVLGGVLSARLVLRRVSTRTFARTVTCSTEQEAQRVLRAAQELAAQVKVALDPQLLERDLRGRHA